MCLDVTAIYQLQYISSLDAFRCWSSKEIPNRKVPFHDSTRCPKHLQWHPNVPLRTSPWHHSFFVQILQFSTAGMSRKTLLFSRHLWSSTSCWWFRNPVITTWDGAKTRRKSWEQTTNLNWLSRISCINMESCLTKTARFDNFRQLQISVNQARGRIHCTGPRRTSSRRKVNLIPHTFWFQIKFRSQIQPSYLKTCTKSFHLRICFWRWVGCRRYMKIRHV